MEAYGSLSGHAQKVLFLIYVPLMTKVLTLGNESLRMVFLPAGQADQSPASLSKIFRRLLSHQEVLDFLVLIYSFII